MDINQNIRDAVSSVFLDLLNKKNYALIETLFAKDAVFYDRKDKFTSRDGLIKMVSARNAAIPDFHYEIKEIIIESEKAAVRWSATGKAIKDFSGFKAGNSANYWGISIFHFKDGKISRNYSNESISDSITED